MKIVTNVQQCCNGRRNKGKWIWKIWKNFMFKKISGKITIEMHCVGVFIVWMIIKKVDLKMLQRMKYIFCNNNPIFNN
jgi:hypothetical protein